MSKKIVITGGGTGIGRAIAVRFAAAGDQVVITGRRAAVLENAAQEIGTGVAVAAFDASDPEAVAGFAADIGQIDVLVNNAGGNTDFDREDVDTLPAVADSWRANFESNVVSAVLMTTALIPAIAEGGAVITIGSIAADKGAGSYGAAKAAVASWNVDLARQLGPRGITANTVAPGYIADTEFFRDALTPDKKTSLIDAAITKRPGNPDDIAGMVEFLASPDARQITAQTFAVNGGEWTTR